MHILNKNKVEGCLFFNTKHLIGNYDTIFKKIYYLNPI